jgi:hypothetical protein
LTLFRKRPDVKDQGNRFRLTAEGCFALTCRPIRHAQLHASVKRVASAVGEGSVVVSDIHAALAEQARNERQ